MTDDGIVFARVLLMLAAAAFAILVFESAHAGGDRSHVPAASLMDRR
jgi:hypothetical protein